jgi:hypothetical protein
MAASLSFAADPGDLDSVGRIEINDLKRHCGTLASDAFEGREAGTNGGRAAAAYLQTELNKIPGLSRGGQNGWVQEFGANYRNLLAVLPGSDPQLKHEVILIGAHYDHVGRGNANNSEGPLGQIHNGADDNASGTSALLELARSFCALKTPPRRTIVFAFWDAEEIGLLGSKHWVSQPTIPVRNLRLVLNIDMLGRLKEGKLIVVGWRSAPGLRSRLAQGNSTSELHLHYEPKVIGDSDHHPFYMAGIPIIHLDTGKHEDYHRPTDDADRLNYEGMKRVAGLVYRVASDAANDSALPAFRREALTEAPPAWLLAHPQKTASVRLGVSFEVPSPDQDRAIISAVTAGSAAERAGLRAGDRIIKFGHWDGTNSLDLRTIIQVSRNPVAVTIERPGVADPLDMQVVLSGSTVRVGISWTPDAAIPEGVVITQVVRDSPADRAGLAIGDVIRRLAGESLGSDDEIRRKLLTNPGPIALQIERHGRIMDMAVKTYDSPAP